MKIEKLKDLKINRFENITTSLYTYLDFRFFLCLSLILIQSVSFSQSEKKFALIYEVSSEQIHLKWFPTTFAQAKALINEGAELSRIEVSNENSNPETLSFESGIKNTISPANYRFQELSKTDSLYSKIESLLMPFLETKVLSTEAQSFSFALLSLENSVSSKLGQIIGSEFSDRDFSIGKSYVYRLRIKGVKDQFFTVEATKTEYAKLDLKPLLLDQKKAVELQWEATKTLAQGFGFYVERKENEVSKMLFEIPYVRGTSKDVVKDAPDFFRDVNFEEGKTYYYRLIGLNYFGEKKLLSDWQKIQIPNFIHGEMYIDTAFAEDENRIINGSFEIFDAKKNNVLKYHLLRCAENKGQYQVVQEKSFESNKVNFTVIEPKTGDRYYYKIAALRPSEDTVLSMSTYLFTLDQEAPEAPSQLTAFIDSFGIVKLSWKASNDSDIQGYRLFRANEKGEEFIEKTSNLITELYYTDTLRLDNLTPECYYFVLATDLNFNTSLHSDTILVLKPDTIAPVPCVISKLETKGAYISLRWINSSSSDVSYSALIRRTNTGIDTLTKWNGNKSNSYIDSLVEQGNEYTYFIITDDKAENTSISENRKLFFELGYRSALKNVKVKKAEKTIELSWDAPKDVFSYTIYRKDNEGSFSQLKTLAPDKTTYSDKNVSLGNNYSYFVQYLTKEGIRSLPSEISIITF